MPGGSVDDAVEPTKFTFAQMGSREGLEGEAALAAELKQALLEIVMVIPYLCGAAHIGASGCDCEERVHAHLARIAEL